MMKRIFWLALLLPILALGQSTNGGNAYVPGPPYSQTGTPSNGQCLTWNNSYYTNSSCSGGVPGVDPIPVWVHVGISISYTSFSTAATTNSINLFTLPAGGVLHGIKIKPSTSFGGGSISAYTISVGISGNAAKYASAFDCFQTTGATVYQLSSDFVGESNTASTQVIATATSTGANLNTATAGSVDIWALVSGAN